MIKILPSHPIRYGLSNALNRSSMSPRRSPAASRSNSPALGDVLGNMRPHGFGFRLVSDRKWPPLGREFSGQARCIPNIGVQRPGHKSSSGTFSPSPRRANLQPNRGLRVWWRHKGQGACGTTKATLEAVKPIWRGPLAKTRRQESLRRPNGPSALTPCPTQRPGAPPISGARPRRPH